MEKTYLSIQTTLIVTLIVGVFFVALGYINSRKTLITIRVILLVIEMKSLH